MNNHHFHPQLQLLTLNCHEAWVHQLESLGCPVDIIDGLPNRLVPTWDTRIRPIPTNGRIISLNEALAKPGGYDCIIAHNIQDLLDTQTIPGTRILVIHNRLESRFLGSGCSYSPDQIKQTLKHYLALLGGTAVAVSAKKGQSWGFEGGPVVEFGIDVKNYPPWRGDSAAGLRIANQIDQKKVILNWTFHLAAFKDVPTTIVGINPGMQGVHPSKNWDDLKATLSSHRFFIHTAHPLLEDGYNMATIEAMAAGLPVLGNVHPTSPVEHGVSGFLSDDPETLKRYAHILLNDQELARQMGQKAQQHVANHFSLSRFSSRFQQAIETALANAPRANV